MTKSINKFLSKKAIRSFLILSSFLVFGGNVQAETNPFTISTNVNGNQAVVTVTYDVNIKPVPKDIEITVKDDPCIGCGEGTYAKAGSFNISETKNKFLFAVDELKPDTTYYVRVYALPLSYDYLGTVQFKTSATITSNPPVSNPLPFNITYTPKKDSLAFTVTNNGSSRYIVMGDLYLQGTTTKIKSSINFGGINSKQVVTQTVTGLKAGTGYDLKLSGVSFGNDTQYFEYKNAATTGSSTPVGIDGGTNPVGVADGTTPKPKKDNSITTGLTGDGSGINNPTNITSIEDFVAKALNIVVDIGTPLVAFFLILSGFMFVAARGNEEKLATAKRSLVYTLIGAALVLGCWGIAQAVKGTIEDVTKTSFVESKEDVL